MTDTTVRAEPAPPKGDYWGPAPRVNAELVWQLLGPKPPVDVPPAPTQPAGRDRRRELFVAACLLAAGAAGLTALALRPSTPSPASGTAAVSEVAGHRVVTITGGRLDTAHLVVQLTAATGTRDLRKRPDGSLELASDLMITRGGWLDLDKTTLHLTPPTGHLARLRVAGGRLTIDHSTVDASGVGGDLSATGTSGRLDLTHATLAGLGTGPASPGVSWRDGALGKVTDSTISGGFRGLYGYRNGTLSVSSSTITGQTESAIIVRSPEAAVEIRGTVASGSGAVGISIIDAARPVRLDDDEVRDGKADGVQVSGGRDTTIRSLTAHDNTGNGLAAASTDGLVVDRTLTYANTSGIVFHAVRATLTHNASSGNEQDGLLVDDPSSAVVIDGDRYDHNMRSGLWLADGRVAIARSRLTQNETGLRMADSSPAVSAVDDVFSNNFKDGVALGNLDGVSIRGGDLAGNLSAAFSLTRPTDITALLRANTVAPGQPVQRVRTVGGDQ